jgi:uncharacterized protein (UPF0332 family)
MEDFVAYVRDVRARDLLERAIVGRGAFRRFKDALAAFPELRRAWFAFHDARGERRAITWLLERGLVSEAAAEAALAARADPEPGDLPGLLDAEGLARRVALDLRRVYRRRLRGVLLAGPWLRGDAHPESAVELIVVLEAFEDRWTERRRMERTLWRHSVRNDAVVTALPVRPGELAGVTGAPEDESAARAVEGRADAGADAGASIEPVVARHLARAREELAAARTLLAAGLPAQATTCAFHAALAGADAALLACGAHPDTAAGSVAAFHHHLVVHASMAPEHARALRRLYDDQAAVAATLDDPPDAEAREAIAAADAIVEACARWLAGPEARDAAPAPAPSPAVTPAR